MSEGPVSPDAGFDSIRCVAVIGAGRRGRAFALRCAQAGCVVVLEDVLSSRLRDAQDELRLRDGRALSLVRLATSVEDAVREADVAVDFVPDELESKLEVFSMMDRMAPPRTIFLTPTALSITDLASCTYRPERCLAMENFAEELAGEVALVRGEGTGGEAVSRVKAWLGKLGVSVSVMADERAPALMRSPPWHAPE